MYPRYAFSEKCNISVLQVIIKAIACFLDKKFYFKTHLVRISQKFNKWKKYTVPQLRFILVIQRRPIFLLASLQ